MVLGANPQGGMLQIGSHSQGGASLHISKLIGGHGRGQGSGRIGCNGKSGEAAILCQQHGNWEPTKVLVLISYKHVKQVIHREFIDPHTHMVPSMHRWEKIDDEL
jgi:hypothetical protein